VQGAPFLDGGQWELGRRRTGGYVNCKASNGLCRTGSGRATGGAIEPHRAGGASGRTFPAGPDRQRETGRMAVRITDIPKPDFGRWHQNLPISNNYQQTHFAPDGHRVDTFGRCVRSQASFPTPRGVAENTKFLDNDFITASR
jgi:hypothetical protein